MASRQNSAISAMPERPESVQEDNDSSQLLNESQVSAISTQRKKTLGLG